MQKEFPVQRTLLELHHYILETVEQTSLPPTLPGILGRWYNTDTGQTLTRSASVYIEPESEDIAYQQLKDALSNIEQTYLNQPIDHFIEKLSAKSSPGDLTDDEKALFRAIGRKSPES